VIVMPRGGFTGDVQLKASGLPEGVTASFNPSSTAGTSTMTVTASGSTIPPTSNITITGTAGNLSHAVTATVAVTPIATGTVPVDLSSDYNVTGIYDDDTKFAEAASLDGGGYSLSEQLLGAEQVGDGVIFKLGPANRPDAVTDKTIALPAGKFTNLKVLGLAVNGAQRSQTFAVTYADGTSSTFTQSLSDWARSRNFAGESVAISMPYRLTSDGSKDGGRTFYGYAYAFPLDTDKEVRSISLPSNRDVLVFAMTLEPAKL
jgi:hypothetical protein